MSTRRLVVLAAILAAVVLGTGCAMRPPDPRTIPPSLEGWFFFSLPGEGEDLAISGSPPPWEGFLYQFASEEEARQLIPCTPEGDCRALSVFSFHGGGWKFWGVYVPRTRAPLDGRPAVARIEKTIAGGWRIAVGERSVSLRLWRRRDDGSLVEFAGVQPRPRPDIPSLFSTTPVDRGWIAWGQKDALGPYGAAGAEVYLFPQEGEQVNLYCWLDGVWREQETFQAPKGTRYPERVPSNCKVLELVRVRPSSDGAASVARSGVLELELP